MNLYEDETYNKVIRVSADAPAKYRPNEIASPIYLDDHFKCVLAEFGDGVAIQIPEQYIIVLPDGEAD